MYNYNLVISIFSKDENLKKIIESISPLEGFKHKVEIYLNLDDEVLSQSDIVLLDKPTSNIIETKEKCKKDAKIIVCDIEFKKDYKNVDLFFNTAFVDYENIEYSIMKFFEQIKMEEDLNYTRTCLNTVIDGIPGMIWIKSNEGIHTLVNKKFCEVVGKAKEDVTGRDHYDIWDVSRDDPNSGADVCKKTEEEVIAAGHTLSFSESVESRNGRMELTTYKTPLYDKNNNVMGTVGFGEDVTELKNLDVVNETLLNSVPFGILIQDNDEKIQSVNRYFEEYFGISKKEIVGMYYKEWVNKTFQTRTDTNNEGFTEGTTYNSLGESKTFELRLNYIRDIFKNKTGKICIFRDVTMERKLEDQILKNSREDSMTGLYIRRYLDEVIAKQPKNAIINLFSIDLDHFKDVNDTYGHQMGDKALILTAKTIKSCFPLDLVFRMGGDEFLVVKVGDYDIDELKQEAQNLLDSISIKFSENNCFGNLSASIGIAQGSLENGIEEIYQKSDKALYEAKNAGRDCYKVYHEKTLIRK